MEDLAPNEQQQKKKYPQRHHPKECPKCGTIVRSDRIASYQKSRSCKPEIKYLKMDKDVYRYLMQLIGESEVKRDGQMLVWRN